MRLFPVYDKIADQHVIDGKGPKMKPKRRPGRPPLPAGPLLPKGRGPGQPIKSVEGCQPKERDEINVTFDVAE